VYHKEFGYFSHSQVFACWVAGGSFALIHTHEMDITKWNKRRGDLYKYGLCLNVLFAFFQVLKMGFLRICEKHKKGHRGDKMKMLNSIWRAQSKPEETLRCSVVFRSSFRISELQIANTSFFSPTRLLKRTSLLQTRIFRGKPLLASTDHSTDASY